MLYCEQSRSASLPSPRRHVTRLRHHWQLRLLDPDQKIRDAVRFLKQEAREDPVAKGKEMVSPLIEQEFCLKLDGMHDSLAHPVTNSFRVYIYAYVCRDQSPVVMSNTRLYKLTDSHVPNNFFIWIIKIYKAAFFLIYSGTRWMTWQWTRREKEQKRLFTKRSTTAWTAEGSDPRPTSSSRFCWLVNDVLITKSFLSSSLISLSGSRLLPSGSHPQVISLGGSLRCQWSRTRGTWCVSKRRMLHHSVGARTEL